MYCSNCGNQINGGNFCSSCGASINGTNNTNISPVQNSYTNTTSSAGSILGTLVTVGLLSGLTRQLYFWNGRYYYDRFCARPYPMSLIKAPHYRTPIHQPIGGMMGGHRGPMGGGFRMGSPGPMGGHGHGGPHR